MCLHVDVAKTAAFRKRYKGQTQIKLYKAVDVQFDCKNLAITGHVCSPYKHTKIPLEYLSLIVEQREKSYLLAGKLYIVEFMCLRISVDFPSMESMLFQFIVILMI
jgi:hypothetical protein